MLNGKPKVATISVQAEQGILIDLTSVSAFGQVDIDTSDWTRGTYYIQVQSENFVSVNCINSSERINNSLKNMEKSV